MATTTVTTASHSRRTSVATTTTFHNPAVSGFAPDPSVVQVDGVFYLVTSSFHIFPGIPVYASTDLQSWTLIGNAINDPRQLDLSKAATSAFPLDTGHTMVASGGLWAPTIRHHHGRFYIVCTNCIRDDTVDHFRYSNFYIHSDDIWSNCWSDAIFVDFHGIDPSLFFDDDGSVYFQGAWELTRASQPSCVIKQMQIDIRTGAPLSDLRDIWQGYAKYDTEGPHIYKKDGYYYLLVAEGGTFENHMLSIARSRSIWGPYESYEKNPILTAKDSDGRIQNAGHGEIFQDADGAWWALFLAVRNGPGGRCPIGRETFLTPVDWPQGGWPALLAPRMEFQISRWARQSYASVDARLRSARGDARMDDVYIRRPNMADYVFPSQGQVQLRAALADLSSPEISPTFVGKRQRDTDFVAQARLRIASGMRSPIRAGLTVYKDDYRHVGIYYDFAQGQVFGNETIKTETPSTTMHHTDALMEETDLHLRIDGSAESYCFSYRQRDDSWKQLFAVDTMKLTARDFTGTIVGLHCNADDGGVGQVVDFDDFVVVAKVQPMLHV